MGKWRSARVQNSADKTGGLVVLPARLWSTRPSAQSADKARKGLRLWEQGVAEQWGEGRSSHGCQFWVHRAKGECGKWYGRGYMYEVGFLLITLLLWLWLGTAGDREIYIWQSSHLSSFVPLLALPADVVLKQIVNR